MVKSSQNTKHKVFKLQRNLRNLNLYRKADGENPPPADDQKSLLSIIFFNQR